MSNLDKIINETEALYDTVNDAMNASYDYMPTGLQGTPVSKEEAQAQAAWDTVGKGAGERQVRGSGTRNIRGR